jgi:flagellar FliJ protein
MAGVFRLQVLLDLAKHRVEAATQELYRLRIHWNEAQAKLDQLEAYQREYAAGLEARMTQGLPAHQFKDYSLFLAKLTRAIQAQTEEVVRRRRAWEEEHVRWRDLRQRQQAFAVLEQRHAVAEAAIDARREQKQQDEFALRAVKNNPVRG